MLQAEIIDKWETLISVSVVFHIRKDGFKDREAVPEELDLVKEESQIIIKLNWDECTE